MKITKISALILSLMLLLQGIAMAAGETEAETVEMPEATPYPYSGEYGSFEDIARVLSELYIDDSYTKEQIMVNGTAELLSGLLKNNEELLVEVLKATLSSFDDYSVFYTADEYKDFIDGINQTSYGIGIVMTVSDDGYIEVSDFVEGNDNAKNAGVKIGDKIYKVNGEDMTGLSVSAVRGRILGEEGTDVTVTFLRGEEEVELTITRAAAINEATVRYTVLEGNIGYIQVMTISADTAEEFDSALATMRKNKVKKIILDLRDNVGGYVVTAVKMAEKIVPKGKIIDVRYRQEEYNVTYNSKLAKKEFDFVILVNEHTASAAEILSSAMQDSKAAKLIGTQTFGKGLIQNNFKLKNGSAMKLTVGQYITRNGNEINGIGLTPDIYVENEVHKIDMSQLAQFDYKERTALGQKSENARAAKERLSLLGFYRGEDDDIYDAELRESVAYFQRVNDIFSYGVLDVPTQMRIEEITADIDVSEDRQFEAAYTELGGDLDKLYEKE